MTLFLLFPVTPCVTTGQVSLSDSLEQTKESAMERKVRIESEMSRMSYGQQSRVATNERRSSPGTEAAYPPPRAVLGNFDPFCPVLGRQNRATEQNFRAPGRPDPGCA